VATLILGALVPIALAWSLNYARVAWARARSSSEAHRRAQQLLRDAEAQLAHAGRRSVMSEMASGLAHELNQPLGAVVNLLDGSLLRLGRDGLPATADVLAALVKARDEAQRAGRIIHGLRGLTGTGEPSRCAVPVAEIVQEAHELAAGEVRAHQVRLVHSLPEEPAVVLADRVQLLQVLLNLVRNAVEAVRGQANGHRLVEMVVVRRGDAMVEIVVRDSGCGITRETAERLFTPFFTTRAGGLGLGLSISRTIVEAHGGRIWAERDLERGAAIHFTVPLAAGGRP
jgi:two-component system sensor kinase FixL